VRSGASQRSAAKRFGLSLSTVQYWLARAGDSELEAVDWNNRPSVALRTGRASSAVEDRVLRARAYLRDRTILGEFGAKAIHGYLTERSGDVPSVRTIGRILERRGALDRSARVRRPPPPSGWYLPDVAANRAELDSFDTVMGLVIAKGPEIEVLNAVSLHGGVVASWPTTGITARTTVEFLVEHWRQFGLPHYAQFDNDTRFHGPHLWADTFGRVTRLCLGLGVVPVFAPPREHGFQNPVESYNGRWQAKVWSRFHHVSLRALRGRSDAYVLAHRERNAARADAAPARRTFPKRWALDLRAPLRGRIFYLRRTNDGGIVDLLKRQFAVRPDWPSRLVRAELDLDQQLIRFYALRRRDPERQPLLKATPYQPPSRPFKSNDR
jgi:hypothetical protein